jgi:hypothetical protein
MQPEHEEEAVSSLRIDNPRPPLSFWKNIEMFMFTFHSPFIISQITGKSKQKSSTLTFSLGRKVNFQAQTF